MLYINLGCSFRVVPLDVHIYIFLNIILAVSMSQNSVYYHTAHPSFRIDVKNRGYN